MKQELWWTRVWLTFSVKDQIFWFCGLYVVSAATSQLFFCIQSNRRRHIANVCIPEGTNTSNQSSSFWAPRGHTAKMQSPHSMIAAVSPWLWGSALRWSANGSPLQAWALHSWVKASFISSDPLLHQQTSSELKQIPIFSQILLSAWIFPRRFLICCLLRCQITPSTITGGRNPLILSLHSRFPQTSCRLYTCVHSVTWLVL